MLSFCFIKMLRLGSSDGQFLVNMLRRLFAIVLIIGLNALITNSEPTYRHKGRSLIDDNTVLIDCAGGHAESPECREVLLNNATAIGADNDKKIADEEKSWNIGDLFDDSTGDEGRQH